MSTSAVRNYRWLFAVLVCFGFLFDQGSKYVVFSWLYNAGEGDRVVLVPETFDLVAHFNPQKVDDGQGALSFLRTIGGPVQPQVNEGALFGIGQGKNLIFGLVSVGAALLILVWSGQPSIRSDLFLSIALGLILAGTLGNLYDRIVFSGVRDFLHWYLWINWPIFNLADCFLVVGASLLLLEAFIRPEPANESKKPDAKENLAAV